MKHINGDTQMTDVWRMPAIAQWEKSCGKHPTQKPLGLLSRIIMASTEPGAWILDPFAGSSTTGIAANLLKRRFLGIKRETEFADISKARREEIERVDNYVGFRRKIPDIVKAEDTQTDIFGCFEPNILDDLPFLTDSADSLKPEPEKVFMYAHGSASRKTTESIGKIAIGLKDSGLDIDLINSVGYIMFHYWNNETATPYKLKRIPRIVKKQDVPDGYMLRMEKDANRFLLLEYNPSKPAEIGSYDILNVQRKGKKRYMPFVASLESIQLTVNTH